MKALHIGALTIFCANCKTIEQNYKYKTDLWAGSYPKMGVFRKALIWNVKWRPGKLWIQIQSHLQI